MVELPIPLTETGPFYRTVEAGDIVYWNPPRQRHGDLRADQPHIRASRSSARSRPTSGAFDGLAR